MIRKTLILTVSVFLFVTAGYAQSKQPKTVRDFFMVLPDKYFGIECCSFVPKSKQKTEYLKRYLKSEDTANGYMSGYGDAAQDGFVMALFKRQDGTYLIGLYTNGEGGAEDTPWTVFLNYSGGKWTDVSRSVVPGHDKLKYIYELPRNGTTVEVFSKKEEADGYKDKKLYDLEWKNGKFIKK